MEAHKLHTKPLSNAKRTKVFQLCESGMCLLKAKGYKLIAISNCFK